jgi:serine/threonine protein kinase
MGACASFAVPAAVGPATELRDPVGDTGSLFSLSNLSSKQSTKWKFRLSRTEALEMFEAEGSIPEDISDDELLLRVCLDDPLFLYRIGHFSKKAGRKFELLLCWADILEFKAIDVQTSDFLVSKAIFIFQKYVKDKSAIQLDLQLPAEWVDNLEATLHSASRGKIIVAIHIFDSFQQMVLRKINEKLFQEYKLSDSYGHTMRDMRREYNQVKPEDFVYLSKLGQGTNGLVVQAVKKSTGKLYALKIQPKSKLLDSFVDDPSRVMSERNVVLSCNHPFVISMHYSFQTPSTVFMAMDLGTGGTLHSALFGCKMGGMSEARIRFYCAEVVLALNHIHQLGLIYRDLKLQNVVLNENGHIRLIDLGEAVNVMKSQRGAPVGKDTFLFTHSRAASDHTGSNAEVSLTNNSGHSKRSEKSVIEKFVNSFAPLKRTNSLSVMLNPSRKSRDLSTHIKLVRALSIVGTNGYMAPELAALEHPNVKDFLQKVGYTKAVDYWALGVMAYQLFTGTMPFEHVDVMYFSESVSRGEVHPQYKCALDVLANSNMAPAFRSFVTDVLQIDESERLGAGAHGFLRLKRHPFFEPIHWTMLGQQQVTPPFLPPANVDFEDDVQYDYDNFLQKMNLTDFASQVPSYEEQEHFSHWYD